MSSKLCLKPKAMNPQKGTARVNKHHRQLEKIWAKNRWGGDDEQIYAKGAQAAVTKQQSLKKQRDKNSQNGICAQKCPRKAA